MADASAAVIIPLAAVGACIGVLATAAIACFVWSRRCPCHWFAKAALKERAPDSTQLLFAAEAVSSGDARLKTSPQHCSNDDRDMGSEMSFPAASDIRGSTGAALTAAQRKLSIASLTWLPPRLSASRSVSVTDASSYSGLEERSVPPTLLTRSISMTPYENCAGHAAASDLSTSASRPGATGFRKARRASMQAAIDYTKIDTALYQSPSPEQTPTIEEEVEAQPENSAGSLLMTLAFHSDTSLLYVKIHSASDLTPFEEGGVRNPYFVLTVLPECNVSRHSKVQQRTSDPSIEEEFVFEINGDLIEKSLLVSLYDFDQFTKSECKGTCNVRLSVLEGKTSELCSRSWITTCKSHSMDPEYRGDLMFSMEYREATEKLTVVIAKARSLKMDFDNAGLGTYVKISVSCGEKKLKKKRTVNAKSRRNPEWNEAVVLPVPRYQIMHVTVEFEVVKDKIAGAEKLGRLAIGPNSSGEEKEHWIDMVTGKSPLEWWHVLRPAKCDAATEQ